MRQIVQPLFVVAALAACPLSAAEALFDELSPEHTGISWAHDNARSAMRYLPESLGPGVAIFDYNNDGRPDLYFVNSGPGDFHKPAGGTRNALYRNDGGGKFTDVTAVARVPGRGFGMGAAAADYDNDGDQDLLVTAYGPLTLYENLGDGTFRDATAKAGLGWDGWTTSAAWLDYDNDGDLDLFVCSFVKFDASMGGICGKNKLGKPFYCIPSLFEPTANRLYRNLGDGTFERADLGTEIAASRGKALGVVASDINGDRMIDLFVASDTAPNFLFMNRGKGTWEEVGVFAEVAYSSDGRPRSGMGVDAADVDGDGLTDLFVANVDGELFSLYRNNGDETFSDDAFPQGIAAATRLLSGWGLKFFDFDNDGDADLLLANGHPDDMVEAHRPRVTYREPMLLFEQRDGTLVNVSQSAGPVFAKRYPARGMAVGDFDGDGRLDVAVGNNGEAPLILQNRAGAANQWVGLELRGSRANRDGIGARIRWSAGGVVRSLERTSGGSYLSSHDRRVVLGLGKAKAAEWIEIAWPAPSMKVERFTELPPGRYSVAMEGAGLAK